VFKAIFFDVDNTLLDFNKGADKAIKKVFGDLGITFSSEMTKTFHEVNDGLWKRLEKEEITLVQLHEIRFGLVLDRLGIKGFDGKDVEQAFLAALRVCAVKIDGAEELLFSLYGKYKLYATSNAPHYQQIARLTNTGLIKYFDDVFTSELIGTAKPEKSFFDGCFERVPDLKKEDVLLVGDSISADIKGGAEYGLKTCWYCPDKEKAKTNTLADYVINELCELTFLKKSKQKTFKPRG